MVFVDEGGEFPCPVFKRLAFTKNGKCLTFRLPLTRLKMRAATKPSFAINSECVKALLEEAQTLMEMRKKAIEKLKHTAHWEALYCRSKEQKLPEITRAINESCALIDETLAARKTRSEKLEQRKLDGVEREVLDGKGRPTCEIGDWRASDVEDIG